MFPRLYLTNASITINNYSSWNPSTVTYLCKPDNNDSPRNEINIYGILRITCSIFVLNISIAEAVNAHVHFPT